MDRILVVHSYHQGLQWTDDISAGIHSVFRNMNVEIHYEYLDTKRNSGEEYYQQLVEFEKQKKSLTDIDFDLLICSDNNALRFVMEHGTELYPGVPVVFCGVNNFSPEMIEGRSDITGVIEAIDYKMNLELIHRLHPERKNIVLIVDRTTTGVQIKEELEQIIAGYPDEYSFEFYQDFVLEDVPYKVSSLGENDVILLLTFNRDIEGHFISYYDGIRMIHDYAKVPIYGAWDFYFGNGIVGGMLTTGRSQGKAAAEMASKLLSGVSAVQLEVLPESPNEMMFDYRELKRFGIDPDRLPEGSLIINRPESLFQRAAEYIVAFMIFISIILCIAAVMLVQQKQREKHLRLMNDELEQRVREKTADLTDKVHVIEEKNAELESALEQINTLEGIIPICSKCKKIRNDKGYWNQVEQYICEHTDAEFSHGLCPDCFDDLYREAKARMERSKD
jgi:ABC-type uncharacterized transport system substrate-binding protein